MQPRVVEDARIVPQSGAEELDAPGVETGGDQGLHHEGHDLRPLRNEHRVRAARRLRDELRRRLHPDRIKRIAFERDDAGALARHHLLEFAFDHVAIRAFQQHGGKRPLAAGDGIFDDAIDIRLRQEAQEIDAGRGDAGVGRERDHRHATLAGRRADHADRMRKQRTDDDLGAFGENLLRRLLRPTRSAAVVLHQELDVGAVEFNQRHLGCVLHRQRHGAGVAAGRQRQDQADPDRSNADRRLLLRRRGRRRIAAEQFGGVGAGREQSQQTAGAQALGQQLQRSLRGRDHGRFPRRRLVRQLPVRVGNRHNEDDRLTKWKG